MKKRVIVIIAVLALAGVFFVLYYLREKDDGAIRTSGIVDGIEVTDAEVALSNAKTGHNQAL